MFDIKSMRTIVLGSGQLYVKDFDEFLNLNFWIYKRMGIYILCKWFGISTRIKKSFLTHVWCGFWSTLWLSETYQVYKTSSGEPEAEEDWQEVG